MCKHTRNCTVWQRMPEQLFSESESESEAAVEYHLSALKDSRQPNLNLPALLNDRDSGVIHGLVNTRQVSQIY